MRQFFKRLLLPIALVAVTQTSIVSAESIRLIGPSGEVQSSPQFSSDIVRNASSSNEPSQLIGPTSESDTLWSIATRIRPSTQVSVQQTLLAIYRLNPQAFENQNIHSLIPGSSLRIPSLEQVSSVSTQEAVNVMAAHQARLNQQPAANTTPSPTPEVASTPAQPTATVEQAPPATDAIKPESAPVETITAPTAIDGSESEIQALEEKNHRLRLMLAEVQTEVSGLKQELGDENRIRSEVEKLLAEERMKLEENQRLAPSQLDQLLSNGWVVAGLALIPGLLIALLVMMFLGRRSSSNAQQDVTQTQMNPVPDAPVAPIIAAEQSLDDLDEELLLDDDLFGGMDDGDSLFAEDKDEPVEDKPEEQSSDSEDENFGFDDADLDFDLDGEDGEDLFAAIDDSGDLDTDFTDSLSSSSGISVSGEEKALGLEEMERALDQVSENDDEDDDEGFDLSDDGEMSQEDIETLLSSGGGTEELDSPTLDQSMLDDLFAQQDDDDDTEDLLNFDSLLDDGSEEGNDSTKKSDDSLEASFASDEELDDLFANIEAQADLDQLEANAKDESELLEDPVDDSLFDLDNTALLDELLTDDSSENEADATDDDIMSELDELLGESEPSDIPEIDENSTYLLDDFVGELSEEPEGYDSFLSDSDDSQEKDEGLELFDELLDIEKSSAEEEQDFNSKNFIDDLINNAPETDPLLDEDDFDLSSELDEAFTDDEFDFSPEIEGLDKEAELEQLSDVAEEPEPKSTEAAEEVIANEFGIPQDDDWAFDDKEASAESQLATEEVEEPTVEPDTEQVNSESEQPEAITEDEPATEAPQQPAADVAIADAGDDAEDILAEFDDSELPEFTEEDALADSETVAEEPEAITEDEPTTEELQQPAADVETADVSDEAEDILAEFDDLELPEFTEEDALADSETVAEEPEAITEDEPATEEPQQPAAEVATADASDEVEDILAEFDDLELPEFTEEDALADSETVAEEPEAITEDEPATEEPQQPAAEVETADASDEVEDILAEFDDSELPEFTEEDALADPETVAEESEAITEDEPATEEPQQPAADVETADASDEVEDILAEFDDSELPEFTEEDVLADPETLAEEPEAITEDEPATEEPQQPAADVETADASDEAEDILAEFDDSEFPEFTEEDALSDPETVAEEPEAITEDEPATEETQQPAADVATADASDEVEDILAEFDDSELPEFTEEDALSDPETVAEESEAITEDEPATEEPQQPAADVETADASDEAEDILAEFDDLELPEYTEEDALADSDPVVDEESEPVAEDDVVELDELELPEYTEDDALVDSEAAEIDDVDESVAKNEVNLTDIAKQEFDEQALSDWLSEDDEQSASFDFDKPIDAQSIDSAGMDIDAMLEVGGEDWNGFNLTPDQQATISDEVPEAERDVWQPENQVQEPEVAEENWGSQDVFAEFDPSTSKFMTIDELMAQTELDDGESLNLDEEELKLDVGLNEFPDVIGDVSDFDVDNNAEAASKLDLAKIYIEMNDDKGAIKLLEEAIVDGSDDIRQQAKHLIDVINGRA